MWIKEFYHKYAEMPQPTGYVSGVEIDEMCHYFIKKTKTLVWKAIDHQGGKLLGWFCGRRNTKVLEQLAEIIDGQEHQHFYTDGYECYKEFFPGEQLAQSKRNTSGIERNNGR